MSKLDIPDESSIKKFNWIDESDIARVIDVLNSGELSGFLAQPGVSNLGGKNVQELEAEWSKYIGSDYAVTFNSWTSGLEAAVAALELKKDSEVIVTPWTMSATVAAIVNNDLIPVFADINRDSFNLEPENVQRKITQRTSAIMAVDIFGKPCEFGALREISQDYGLSLIIDAAQAPGASRNSVRSALSADIAGYSFNRHKHIQSGEGGIAVTSKLEYLKKMQLARNHSEVSSVSSNNIIKGHNYRFGEIEASLILGQLSRINDLLNHRRLAGEKLVRGLSEINGITTPTLYPNEIHDFYILGLELETSLSKSRSLIVKDLRAIGLPGILEGYVNVHMLPQFERFNREPLPVAEDLHNRKFIGIYMCGIQWDDAVVELYLRSFKRVIRNYVGQN